jgi:copper/silver efflux system protein
MVNLPLALVGGVFAVLLTGGVLNIATLVGFITLFGIAVRNGILMVSHYNHLLREGVPLEEAVSARLDGAAEPGFDDGAHGRTRAAAARAGGRRAGQRDPEPHGVVVLGGLLTSLLLNMVVVPVLFHALRHGPPRRRTRNNRRREPFIPNPAG